ncbi:MAG: M28 family peptidase [Bacteroidetes bacterium]|nr:M28 family peptidase [Bacteroidota bacterium]
MASNGWKRGKARNSDHYWFSEKGVPAFFFYTTGGSKAYHDIYDVPSAIQLTEFGDVKKLIYNFVLEVGRYFFYDQLNFTYFCVDFKNVFNFAQLI